jgi:peptidoglycan/LPS O-acetylase OafA/YrhL
MCFSYPLAVWIFPKLQALVGHAMPWWVYASFTQNFWLAHHPWDSYLDVTWSLAVEEQFYLTLPALIWLTPKKHLWKVAVALCVATPLLRSGLYLYYYPNWRAAAYTLMISPPTRSC